MKWEAFIGGSSQALSPLADCERTVNLYRSTEESEGATARRVLYPSPGVSSLDEAAAGPGRAHYVIGGREFAIIGTILHEADSDGDLTALNSAVPNGQRTPPIPNPDNDPVTMSGGGDLTDKILITAASNAYTLTMSTNAVAQVTALNGIATCGAYLEGYGLALDADTSKLYVSAVGNLASWTTGTDYTQRSLAPDPWWMMKTAGRLVWLWGEQTSEIWQNVGSQSFPFAPHPSGLLQLGIIAPWSAAVSGNEVYWLARLPSGRMAVVTASGFQPQVISTRPVERFIESYTYPELAIGDIYSENGHTFYSLNFDRDNATWVYDTAEREWHERGTWDTATGSYKVWRPRYHALAFGEHRMLDASSGHLYRMSTDYTSDVDGLNIRRIRRAPAIWKEGKRIAYPGLVLGMDVGLAETYTAEPQIVLRISNDGGYTWVAELPGTAGARGDYLKRVKWNRLGTARRRVFEVVMTDAEKWRIVEADFDPEPEVEQ